MPKSFSRRRVLRFLGVTANLGLGLVAYTTVIEPSMRLKLVNYTIQPQLWTADCELKIAALADLHAGEGYMDLKRVAEIVAETNKQKPDIIVLLGDYLTSSFLLPGNLSAEEIAGELSKLEAPLGVVAIMGNHDWWNDEAALRRRHGPIQMEMTCPH